MSTTAPQRRWLLSPPGLLLSFAVLSGGIAWWLIALPVLTLSNVRNHSTHFPHVFLHADEPDEVMQNLLEVAENTCYLHAALRSALPSRVELTLNGGA